MRIHTAPCRRFQRGALWTELAARWREALAAAVPAGSPAAGSPAALRRGFVVFPQGTNLSLVAIKQLQPTPPQRAEHAVLGVPQRATPTFRGWHGRGSGWRSISYRGAAVPLS